MTSRISGAAAFLIGLGAASGAGAMDRRAPDAAPPQGLASQAAPAALEAAPAPIAAASADPTALRAGSPSTFRLQAAPEAAAARSLAAGGSAGAGAEPALEIQFQNLQAAPDSVPGLRVFLGKPDATIDTPVEDPHYVGSISFFSFSPNAAEGPRFTLPLGDTLSKLEAAGLAEIQPGAADVTLIPVDLGSGAAPPFTVRLTGMGIR